MGNGAENGLRFKNGAALDKALKIRAAVLDKTGIVTRGEPAVTDVIPSKTWDGDGQVLLRLVACAERGSEHPLGDAVVRKAKEQKLVLVDPTAPTF